MTDENADLGQRYSTDPKRLLDYPPLSDPDLKTRELNGQ